MTMQAGMYELIALLAADSHPNVMRLLGVVQTDSRMLRGDLEFLLDFAEHGSLAKLFAGDSLVRKVLLSDPDCLLSIAQDLVRGLAHLHSRGLMHRDLGLRNALLNARGRAVLGDFGLTRFVDDKGEYPLAGHNSKSGSMLPFIDVRPTIVAAVYSILIAQAPECSLVGKNPTLATDIWTFGAMLLELICGRGQAKSATSAVAGLQAQAVTVDGLTVHANVVKAIAGCLVADPMKRATAADICAMLDCKFDATSPVMWSPPKSLKFARPTT